MKEQLEARSGRRMREQLIMVGAFPPPLHGMAVVNDAMKALIERRGRKVIALNISAPSFDRGAVYHLVKAWRVVRAFVKFGALKAEDSSRLYMSVSSGYGMIYETFFALLARRRQIPVTLHHHSYNYLNRRSLLARLLFSLCPLDTQHIALSGAMADVLRRMYGVSNVRVISNAAFLGESESDVPVRPLTVLGFLSNISRQKGIHEFIALIDACNSVGLRIEGVIAGPFQDESIEAEVRRKLVSRQNVRYVGPQYGVDKDTFLRTLDVLIFPSHNEAEPVTIHEALRMAVPVIAVGHGAIPEMLNGKNGASIPCGQDFVSVAVQVLLEWLGDEGSFRQARAQAIRGFSVSRELAIDSMHDVLDAL